MTNEQQEDVIKELERIQERLRILLLNLKQPTPQPLSGGGPGEEK